MPKEIGTLEYPIRFPGEFFRTLSLTAWNDVTSYANTFTYLADIAIFSERDLALGLYIILEGAVRLSTLSSDGRRFGLRIARRGQMLGLSSVLSGHSLDATAETISPTRLAFLGRSEFLGFLSRHPTAYRNLSEEFIREHSMTCAQLRTVGLAPTVPAKLAHLLLNWSEYEPIQATGARVPFSLTHEEMGEFIGASRETVSRALSVFRSQRLVAFDGSTITIPCRRALANYACL